MGRKRKQGDRAMTRDFANIPATRIYYFTEIAIDIYYKTNLCLRLGGYPDLFVKLDFEIAVEHQTRERDRTLGGGGGGFRTPGAHRCLWDSHAHIWSTIGLILSNHLNMLKTMLWGALLVATNLMNTCI